MDEHAGREKTGAGCVLRVCEEAKPEARCRRGVAGGRGALVADRGARVRAAGVRSVTSGRPGAVRPHPVRAARWASSPFREEAVARRARGEAAARIERGAATVVENREPK